MLEVALHAGTEHPNLLWVIIPSILTFLAGVGIGHYSDTIRSWVRTSATIRD